MAQEKAVFAGGCFWCTEAVFKRLNGVVQVTPGYTGGKMDNPDYDHVSMGNTGHAEAIEVIFDPSIISYETLLDVFFGTHDPTTLNAQGADIGTQYRSAIFYTNEDQHAQAVAKIKELEESHTFPSPIVTQVEALTIFYSAEEYHKDYYAKNRDSNGYCRVVIDPKVKKLLTKFSKEVKAEYQQA